MTDIKKVYGCGLGHVNDVECCDTSKCDYAVQQCNKPYYLLPADRVEVVDNVDNLLTAGGILELANKCKGDIEKIIIVRRGK